METSNFDDRIKLLLTFREDLIRWWHSDHVLSVDWELRASVNRRVLAVRQAVDDVGCLQHVQVGNAGRLMAIEPFSNLFSGLGNDSIIPGVVDMVDQALGAYENLRNNTGLVQIYKAQGLDIVGAINRALRPSFRQPPTREKDVQDVIETILNAIGIEFLREKEVVSTGGRVSKPDFTLEKQSLVLEVKLAKEGHGASEVQEEINADIAAYKTKWKHLLFVVYDLGVIADPLRLERENTRLFGVTVKVVKH